MEHILSKKLTLVLAVMIAALGLNTAATNSDVKVLMHQGDKQNLTTMSTATWQGDADCIVNMANASNQPLNFAAKANEPTITVTFVPDCDETLYYKKGSTFSLKDEYGYNHNFYSSNISWGITSIQITPGVYDVLALYPFIDQAGIAYGSFVIHEQVEFTNDTTVSINPAEATNLIQFDPCFPNGEKCQVSTLRYDENYNMEIVEPGNIGKLNFMSGVAYKDGTPWLTYGGEVGKYYLPSGQLIDQSKGYNFYVNDVSDRFSFFSNMGLIGNEFDGNFYSLYFETPSSTSSVISNHPEDYVMCETQYKQSPYGKDMGNDLHLGFQDYLYSHQGLFIGFRVEFMDYTLQDGETCKLYFCSNPESGNSLYRFVQSGVIDALHPEDPTGQLMIWDTHVTLQDGDLIHVNNGLASLNKDCFTIIPDPHNEYGYTRYFTGFNPQFSYQTEKMRTLTGNSCPILVQTLNSWIGEDGIEKYLQFENYIGRNGELRESDICKTHGIVKANGSVIGEGDMFSGINWTKSDNSQGLVDINITNENVEVDGLAGKNEINVHFKMSGDDNTAPTLQMLDFRDTDNNAIDRFATAEEGMLQFYCGDFNERYTEQGYPTQYFVCDDLANVEVAYSPYQADTWTALDATEVAEYYYDGMGHYYTTPLVNVTGEAYQGWFDLKIRLTDAAGNWQEQVISPAFRIDNLAYSGIAEPRSNNAHEVARYNLAGQRVDGNATGVVIVKMSDGTARKILVP